MRLKVIRAETTTFRNLDRNTGSRSQIWPDALWRENYETRLNWICKFWIRSRMPLVTSRYTCSKGHVSALAESESPVLLTWYVVRMSPHHSAVAGPFFAHVYDLAVPVAIYHCSLLEEISQWPKQETKLIFDLRSNVSANR